MKRSIKRTFFSSVLVLGIILFALTLLLAGTRQRFNEWARLHTELSMKEIGFAVHWYHSSNKCLPPPYITDSSGQPGLSWRVALLPMIGEEKLFQKFRLDEPWDSPTNLALADEMPVIYRSVYSNTPSRCCPFFVITDSNTAFPEPVVGNTSVGFKNIEDGLTQTLLCVELRELEVIWTKPVVLRTADALELLNRRKKDTLLTGFLDGSVSHYRNYIGESAFKAICTRAGGERVDLEALANVSR